MPYAHNRSSPMASVELVATFEHQLRHCRLQPHERVVVITDPAFDPSYAAACMGAAQALGCDAFQVLVSSRKPWSEETLGAVFEPADLIVYATTHALHYSEAMRAALASGKRALMTVVPPHVLERRVADAALIERTKAGARILDAAGRVDMRSNAGTELSMSIAGRPGVASYGVADEPGHLDFWGAGCFQIALVEGTLEGRLVLDVGDQVFHFGRYVDRAVTITFESGRAVAFDGGVEGALIERHLSEAGDDRAVMAGHIAFGADPAARWSAEAAQFPVAGGGGADAEAYYGCVQIELGSNDDVMFRGKNRSSAHLGLCALHHDATVDGAPLLADGQLVPRALAR